MTIGQVPAAVAIYADEDRIDPAGRRSDWRFKPAWSPHWLRTTNYLGHLTLLRRAAVRDIGGWRSGSADAQHDLLLRLTRDAEPRAIVHLAKLLVHAAEPLPSPAIRRAAPQIPDPPPRVSLIIPTRDGADVLATCIRSIRALTRYPDYEIIIVDNGSVQDDTRRLFAELSRRSGDQHPVAARAVQLLAPEQCGGARSDRQHPGAGQQRHRGDARGLARRNGRAGGPAQRPAASARSCSIPTGGSSTPAW